MADVGIPEKNMPKPTMVPAKKPSPSFGSPEKLDAFRKKARNAALKSKVLQAKNGSAHEQHVAHMQHMQHEQNQFRKNQNSKNPYSK